MTTGDHYAQVASLESALQQSTYELNQTATELAAEKASHTDTLVKLRLTEEALKASEAERSRWRTRADDAIKLLSSLEREARKVLRDEADAKAFAEEVIIGNAVRCHDDELQSGECYCSELRRQSAPLIDDDLPTEPTAAKEPG